MPAETVLLWVSPFQERITVPDIASQQLALKDVQGLTEALLHL